MCQCGPPPENFSSAQTAHVLNGRLARVLQYHHTVDTSRTQQVLVVKLAKISPTGALHMVCVLEALISK